MKSNLQIKLTDEIYLFGTPWLVGIYAWNGDLMPLETLIPNGNYDWMKPWWKLMADGTLNKVVKWANK